MKKILMFLVVLCMIPVVYPATIQGTVYDMTLSRVDSATVEIDTIPKQRDITENGEYSFSVGVGNYTLLAGVVEDGYTVSTTSEKVEIVDDGVYNIDLILFPELEEDVVVPELEDLFEPEEEQKTNVTRILIIIFMIVFFILLWYFKSRKKKPVEVEGDISAKILEFIKAEGGRTTQKDIRKQFPSSEAKISLVIAELESKGKIEKIKKGRGNIIKIL